MASQISSRSWSYDVRIIDLKDRQRSWSNQWSRISVQHLGRVSHLDDLSNWMIRLVIWKICSRSLLDQWSGKIFAKSWSDRWSRKCVMRKISTRTFAGHDCLRICSNIFYRSHVNWKQTCFCWIFFSVLILKSDFSLSKRSLHQWSSIWIYMIPLTLMLSISHSFQDFVSITFV